MLMLFYDILNSTVCIFHQQDGYTGLTLEMYMAAKTQLNWGILRVFWGRLGCVAEYGFILECIMHITFFMENLFVVNSYYYTRLLDNKINKRNMSETKVNNMIQLE